MNTSAKPAISQQQSKRLKARPAFVCFITTALLSISLWRIAPLGAIWYSRDALRHRNAASGLLWLNRASWFCQYDAEIEFLRARCYRRLGNAEAFRNATLVAAKLGFSPDLLDREQTYFLAQTGQLEEIEYKMGKIFRESGEDSGEACEAYTSGLLLNLRHTEALNVADSWARDYPQDPQPELVRGMIFNSLSRPKLAESAFRSALELDPDSTQVQLRLGELLIANRKLDEAIIIFRMMSRHSEQHDVAWLNISIAERLKGDLKASGQALENVQNPSQFKRGEYELHEGLLAIDQQDYAHAELLLRRLTENHPRLLEARNGLALALRALGKTTDATEQARQVVTAQNELTRSNRLYDEVVAKPNDPVPRIQIGKIELQYGDEKRGVAWLLSGLNLQPDNTEALQSLTKYYEDQALFNSDYAEMATHFRERLESQK